MKHSNALATALLLSFVSAQFSPVAHAEQAPNRKSAGGNGSDYSNVSYGPDPANKLDFWKARSDKPTPLVIHIHGGGFSKGGKGHFDEMQKLMQAGVSCASLDYRLAPQFAFPAPMHDCARAVQFLRYKAAEWNLDPNKFACVGTSAGGGISLWLGFHDDLADPKNSDPVARQSTRLTCMAVENSQTSYDPRFLKQNIPGNACAENALLGLFGIARNEMMNPPPEKAKLIEDSSPINHVSAGDPPAFLYSSMMTFNDKDKPGDIHHIKMGILLKEKMDALKIECELVAKDPNNPSGKVSTGAETESVDFLLRQLEIGKK